MIICDDDPAPQVATTLTVTARPEATLRRAGAVGWDLTYWLPGGTPHLAWYRTATDALTRCAGIARVRDEARRIIDVLTPTETRRPAGTPDSRD